jgi:hypothetical protein
MTKGKNPFPQRGHRVLHDSLHYGEPELITPQMKKALTRLESLVSIRRGVLAFTGCPATILT